MSRKGGFTLVDSLVSGSILLMGCLACAGVLSKGTITVAAARNEAMAMHECRDLLERLRPLSFGHPDLSAGWHEVSSPRFTGYYNVDVSPLTKDVTMVLRWIDRGSRQPREIALTTTYAKALHR